MCAQHNKTALSLLLSHSHSRTHPITQQFWKLSISKVADITHHTIFMLSPFSQQRILQYLSCRWCVTKWMFEKAGAGVWPSPGHGHPGKYQIQPENGESGWMGRNTENTERRGSRDICKSLKRLTTAATACSLLSLFGQKIGNTHTDLEFVRTVGTGGPVKFFLTV